MNANKTLTAIENHDIENFIARKGWVMQETGSGLRYFIYEQGSGRAVRQELAIRFSYEISLLTGKICYTSKEFGPKEFLVGKGGVESGLEEAVLLLREGDKAKIILPSHLAFGLLGDEDCIPKRAAIVYDLEVLTVLDPIKRN